MTIPGNIHLIEYAHTAYGIWDMGNEEEWKGGQVEVKL